MLPFSTGKINAVVKNILFCHKKILVCGIELIYKWANTRDKHERAVFSGSENSIWGSIKEDGIPKVDIRKKMWYETIPNVC